MYTPVDPNFPIQKWDLRGSTLHGHVSMNDDLLIFPKILNKGTILRHVATTTVFKVSDQDTIDDLFLLHISSRVVWQSRDLQLSRNTLHLLSSSLLLHSIKL